MICYDPRGMSWNQWCALTTELFASQQLGIVDEENWRQYADGMAGIGYFLNFGTPDSRGFNTWQDWASRLVGIINLPNPSNYVDIPNQLGSATAGTFTGNANSRSGVGITSFT